MIEKTPQHMTSSELDEALERHLEFTKKLIEEVRNRRAKESQNKPVVDSSEK